MSYAVLMVQLELGQTNAGVFDAHVIGIAVRRPIEIGYGDGFIDGDGRVAAGFIDQGRTELDGEAIAVEHAFHARFRHLRPLPISWPSKRAMPIWSSAILRHAISLMRHAASIPAILSCRPDGP